MALGRLLLDDRLVSRRSAGACRLLALVLGLGACSGSEGIASFSCDPQCPPGQTCTETGCVRSDPGVQPDLAVTVADMAGAGCSPACMAPTPVCGPAGRCVPCIADGDCGPGRVCTAGNVCLQGCKDDAGCGGARACCSGHCVDPMIDGAHCGRCGNACSAPHATAVCTNGACTAGRCVPGWDDCNRDPADGCEVNLHADTRNCSACGKVCALDNANVGCAKECYLAACHFGFDDCNGNSEDGCETSTLSDPKNCGGCARSCPNVPNASSKCRNAFCALDRCNNGFLDCDGLANNGCEVVSASDRNNCGVCGNVCPQGLVCRASLCTCPQCNIPNASATCVNNMCILERCNPGYSDCDGNVQTGCEVESGNDPKNCGGCGVECPQQMPSCSEGKCTNKLRVVPGFMGEVGPDYTRDDWVQCVGIFDKANSDDLPMQGWGAKCIDNQYTKLRLACGANANSVQFIDISRNVLATKLNAYPEKGLINNASFNLNNMNDIYGAGNDPNNGTSWWVNGNGCNEASPSITINNGCPWDVANCFGQNINGERYFYVYVHK